MIRKPINVVVGILIAADERMLYTQRPAGKPYPGYWEFPGGKVEAGESLQTALSRELREELGIEVTQSQPWCCIEHIYEHAHVRLHCYYCTAWENTPVALEGQALCWDGATSIAPLLPTMNPILEWLKSSKN